MNIFVNRIVLAVATLIVMMCLIATPTVAADSVSWTQLGPSGGRPVARILHTSVYNPANNRMIVFGGLNGAGMVGVEPLLNDVWVLSNADGSGATPTWTLLSPTGGPPSARGYHASVYDAANNRMMVFAGDPSIGYCSGAVNDVWVLSNADGTGGTPNWTQLNPSGGPPPLRQGTKAVYDSATNRMVVFGGNSNACGTPSNAVWVLSNANGLGGTPVWTQLAPVGAAPAARSTHSAVYDSANNRMVVFGGGTSTVYVNDVWVLENANGLGGTPAWTKLNPTGEPPSARTFSTAMYVSAANSMVLFGGFPTGGSSAVWVLNNANGLGGTPSWAQQNTTGVPPSPRHGHTSVFNASTNRMVMFGGDSCTGACSGADYFPLNDVWVLPLGAAAASTVPGAPTIGTAIGGNGQATVNFAAPASDGGLAISGYTVTSSPSGLTASGSASPITVTGLINGTAYTFTVTASNSAGTGVASAASNSVTPSAAGVGSWTQLSPSGGLPLARILHTTVYNPSNNRMIVFGGLNGAGVIGVDPLLNDVWVLASADGSGGTPTWTQLSRRAARPAPGATIRLFTMRRTIA
jgi:hypothetical protein